MENKPRKTLAVLIDWPEGSGYHRDLMSGMHAEAERQDVNLLVMGIGPLANHVGDRQARMHATDLLGSPRIDGAVLYAAPQAISRSVYPEIEAIAKARVLPMISIGDAISGVQSILLDNCAGFSPLLDHLFGEHGYTRPVFVAGPVSSHDSKERLVCFHKALRRHGLRFTDRRVYHGDFTWNSGAAAVSHFLENQRLDVDVFVCANDMMALGVREALKQRGEKTGERYAVTGFDNVSISVRCASPLSTVHQPIRDCGELAVRMLAEQVRQKNERGPTRHILPTRAIFRSTCGCPVHPDPQEPMTQQDDAIQQYRFIEHYRTVNTLLTELVNNYYKPDQYSSFVRAQQQLKNLLGLKNWFITDFQDSPHPIPDESIFWGAQDDVKRLMNAAPELSPRGDDLIPYPLETDTRWTMVFQILESADMLLGTLTFDYQPHFRELYELFRQRLSEALSLARVTRKLTELNEELLSAARKLQEMSHTDELTGLENRRGFLSMSNHQLACARRQSLGSWVIYMDLDGLKIINDTWGHDEGDQAIKAFACCLRQVFRESDIIARMGGDEFTLLASNSRGDEITAMRERLEQAADTYNQRMDHQWKIAFSMGAVFSEPHDSCNVESLLQEADIRLYWEKQEKKHGKTNQKKRGSPCHSG